ncbi:MAG: thioredoxin family protein [Patescibacteria group bacterium]|nr:thioredoxin family protein [Patescibacteria group bacterium]
MSRGLHVLFLLSVTVLTCGGILSAQQAVTQPAVTQPAVAVANEVHWFSDYGAALAAAKSQQKMLLVFFCDPSGNSLCNRFQAETLSAPEVRKRMADYVCVQVPLDMRMTIQAGGNREEITLLRHEAFEEMLGRPGIAIIDYANRDAAYYKRVVSTFPVTQKLWYTPDKMLAILGLPAGTLTQRTLIYAVRTHAERPGSTEGRLCSNLAAEATEHSQYQARIRRQGHHFWETRFQRITRRLPGGLVASEVCAESWPGERLVEAAIECVRCWRLSSGHWSAVRARHDLYAYDMKRGSDGIWYATGIFGQRR